MLPVVITQDLLVWIVSRLPQTGHSPTTCSSVGVGHPLTVIRADGMIRIFLNDLLSLHLEQSTSSVLLFSVTICITSLFLKAL